MRALVLEKQGSLDNSPLKLQERGIPSPKKEEALIQVLYCGVCLTDKHIVEGELKAHGLPRVVGHQVVGKVIKVGTKIHEKWVGKYVGVYWLHSSCRKCEYCLHGLENLCEKAKFTGYDVDGGYAEYMLAHAEFMVELDESMATASSAPLLCAGVVGYRAYKLSSIQPGQTLGLIGFGASAHLIAQLALYEQCTVYAMSRDQHHLDLAKKLGVHWAGKLDETPPEKMDAAILFAPVGNLIDKVLSHLKKAGTLAINAIHMSEVTYLNYQNLFYEKRIQSVSNVTRADAAGFIEKAKKAKIAPIVEIFPLEKANEALCKQKESKHLGALVLKP